MKTEDPKAKTAAALRASRLQLDELVERRRSALLLPNGLAEIRALDEQIVAAGRDQVAMRERLELLKVEAAKVERQRLELERAAAIEATIQPPLAELVQLTERFEQELAVPAATYGRIKELFDQHRARWPIGRVPIPPEYFAFTLAALTSQLKVALEACARSHDFENIVERLTMFGTMDKPSAVMAKQLALFLEELQQMPLPESKNVEGVS